MGDLLDEIPEPAVVRFGRACVRGYVDAYPDDPQVIAFRAALDDLRAIERDQFDEG